jgi:hypothetical protein
MALVSTPGAANANTYATLAEADAYMEARLYTEAWDDATDSTKEKALKMAARQLDLLKPGYTWTGAAVDETQALAWPRSAMLNRNGFAIATTAIPVDLKYAQIEFANALLAEDRTADSDIETQGITKIKAGNVELGFRDNVKAKVMPDVVLSLLVPSWYDDGAADSFVFRTV